MIGEMQCRALLQVLLIGAGIDVVVEKHMALGRSDLEVETGNRRWIFEFKWDEGTKNGPDRSALLGHNFVYQETKPHGFYSSFFTKEFRLNAAKLVVDEHRPAVDVARELDINPKSLYSWVRQYRSGLLQASLDGEDSVSAEQAEIARLRSELQKSRAEVLLLKKFAAYLSKNGLQ